MSSFSYKGILSILVSVFLVSGIMYASSTIISVQTQSIAQGDVIANGWFQEVNDSILSQRTGINTLSGQIQTLSGVLGNQWKENLFGIDYSNGNVGIGTNTPTSKIEIKGGVGLLTSLGLKRGMIFAQEGTSIPGHLVIRTSHGEDIAFQDDSNPIDPIDTNMIIKGGNGNVGIGTTTPGAKLDVNGLILSSGDGKCFPISGNTTWVNIAKIKRQSYETSNKFYLKGYGSENNAYTRYEIEGFIVMRDPPLSQWNDYTGFSYVTGTNLHTHSADLIFQIIRVGDNYILQGKGNLYTTWRNFCIYDAWISKTDNWEWQ